MSRQPGSSSPSPNRRDRIIRARKALRAGALDDVLHALAPLLTGKKADAEALFLAGLVAERRLDFEGAREFARRSMRIREHPDALRLLASSFRSLGDLNACLKTCDRLIRSAPDPLQGLAIQAEALQERRDFEQAEAVLNRIDELCAARNQPVPGPIRLTRVRLRLQQSREEEAIQLCEALLSDPTIPPAGQRQVQFERAKALDRLGRFDEAFGAASSANEINEPSYDPAAHEHAVGQLIEQWSGERMQRFPVSECTSAVPVFIAGMPRSGTSLVDQIIDSHPEGAGVGELQSLLRFAGEMGQAYDASREPPECFGPFDDARWTKAAESYLAEIRREAPSAKRIVNKALGNDMLVGMLARLFPETRIIHVRRDPRDVAISCFMGAFNTNAFPLTARIEWAASAWAQSERLMDHWKAALDVPILELRYEELVQDPDAHIPRLLEFIGLGPHEACFRFHTRKRKVRTLSFDQVSRPMYTSSAGRHANYAEQIAGVDFPAYP